MNTVGVGAGSNLQFYNMVIPDLNGTLTGASSCLAQPCTPPDPSAFLIPPLKWRQLANELGGAILMGHSESSAFPTRAALQPASGCYPWTSASACKVKGIIQLETVVSANLTPAEITTLSHIPILIEYGDYTARAARQRRLARRRLTRSLRAGGDIKFAWLPAPNPRFPLSRFARPHLR